MIPDDDESIHLPPTCNGLILVVDDQAPNIQMVGAMLSRAGYSVMPALSGEQALKRCEQRVPDLALLDMRMPGMDGFELCQRLHSQPGTEHVPVIFLTAANERDVLVKAFEIGAVDYVTKPFVAAELLARVKTHLELKAARDHLSQLARERAELTQVVAHDLKSPIAAILMASESLCRAQLPVPHSELAKMIGESANRCLSFIDEYLGRWAASEAPRQIELAPVAIRKVLTDTVDAQSAVAAQQGMSLRLSLHHDCTVLANEAALRRLVENLLSNAIKYGAAQRPIDLECSLGKSGMVRVTVSDCGPGVPEKQRENLFKRYVKLPGAEVAHSSGLGLAISREQAERMGGHLWYEDRDGGGACFVLMLPLAGE